MAFRTSTSRTNNVTEGSKSRFTQGGEADRFATRVGWWERRVLREDDTDLKIQIRPNEDRKPHLVAFRLYQDPTLSWLVLQFNKIVDVETQFRAGTEIRLPTERRVYLDILNQQTGGNVVSNNRQG